MGGRKEPKPATSKVDPTQQPFLEDIRGQAQQLFRAGGPTTAGIDESIAASLAPLERSYTEQIFPQLTSAAEQAGAYGGSALPQVRGRAGQDYASEAARVALTMRPQLEAQALQQQWGPLANYAQIVGAPTMTGTGGMPGAPGAGASILSGALGGAAGGGALAGGMGLAGAGAFAPWMLGGAALGGLAGAL